MRDIAANIHFFGGETAGVLEFRLNNQLNRLSPLLIQSWRLILRHMRAAKRRGLQSDWFDIAPRWRRRSKPVSQKLKTIGFDVMIMTQAEASDYFKSEVATWGKMTRAIGYSSN